MIILDTNVITEVLRDGGQQIPWFRIQDPDTLHISVTTLCEVTYGLDRMPAGKHREFTWKKWLALEPVLRAVALPVNSTIADMAGVILARRESAGRRIELADAQIAATAVVHHATIATRNVKDFEDLGLTLVNPWEWQP